MEVKRDAIIEQLVVNLVRNDVQVVLDDTHPPGALSSSRRVDHAGGVGGVIEEACTLVLAGDGRLQAAPA